MSPETSRVFPATSPPVACNHETIYEFPHNAGGIMATITVNSEYWLDMSGYDFSWLYYGESYKFGTTQYLVDYGDGGVDAFGGFGFTYSGGVPTGGTVTS